MATVTALEVKAARHPLVRLFLDGRYAFSLEPGVAVGLRVEQQLTESEITGLQRTNEKQRALASAFRSLANRPRSSREIRQKLYRNKFDEQTVEAAVGELTAGGLLDDAAFARYWCENRDSFRPRSSRLITAELRGKGIDADTAAGAISEVDDEAGALRAAAKKVKTLGGADRETFFRRLGDYLKRRGYNYEIIQKTVRELWQKQRT